MIAKVESMNMRQENESLETKSMLENNQENESEKAQTM